MKNETSLNYLKVKIELWSSWEIRSISVFRDTLQRAVINIKSEIYPFDGTLTYRCSFLPIGVS